jgi:hypothetical protein
MGGRDIDRATGDPDRGGLVSWRDIEGKRIEQVIPVDQSEIVLKLEGGKLARLTARAPADTPETPAQLDLDIQKAQS